MWVLYHRASKVEFRHGRMLFFSLFPTRDPYSLILSQFFGMHPGVASYRPARTFVSRRLKCNKRLSEVQASDLCPYEHRVYLMVYPQQGSSSSRCYDECEAVSTTTQALL